jgi:hypothetical protein
MSVTRVFACYTYTWPDPISMVLTTPHPSQANDRLKQKILVVAPARANTEGLTLSSTGTADKVQRNIVCAGGGERLGRRERMGFPEREKACLRPPR